MIEKRRCGLTVKRDNFTQELKGYKQLQIIVLVRKPYAQLQNDKSMLNDTNRCLKGIRKVLIVHIGNVTLLKYYILKQFKQRQWHNCVDAFLKFHTVLMFSTFEPLCNAFYLFNPNKLFLLKVM